MAVVSTNHMQSNGYRLNVENSKYLIFDSEDYSKKIYHLERIAFDLIDFFEFSEDNQEKQDEIYSRMLAMENFLESLPVIKIKVCYDKFDFNTEDIDDFEDPFGIEFPTIDYYFHTTHFEEYSDFVTFYNTLKSDEVKEKFKDLLTAVDDVLQSEYDNK